MRLRVGCEFDYESAGPTPTIWQVRPRAEPAQSLAFESWGTSPELPWTSYGDAYGNVCDRLTLPKGRTVLRYDAHVEVPGLLDEANPGARQVPVELLPDDTMVFLLPSRFCLSDVLRDQAWELFGATEPGWPRVVAVCDWAPRERPVPTGEQQPADLGARRVAEPHRRLSRLRSPRAYFVPEPQYPGPVCLRVPARCRRPPSRRAHGLLCLVRGLP